MSKFTGKSTCRFVTRKEEEYRDIVKVILKAKPGYPASVPKGFHIEKLNQMLWSERLRKKVERINQ